MGYLRLLWMYYDSEKPLKPDAKVLAFQIGATVEETELLLESFFWLAENGWHHTRCDKEIADYREFLNKKSSAGKASAEQRKNKSSTDVQQVFNNSSTDVQLTTNHKPLTINHKPNKEIAIAICPINVDEQVWSDFLALRKVKKAPMTVTALAVIKREADKANWSLDKAISECVARGWTGFKADWVAEKANRFDVVLTTTPPPPNQDAALKRIMEDDKKAVPPSLEILAKLASFKRKVA
jgi:uncharacterized protein YdaU (DUF1376 family)